MFKRLDPYGNPNVGVYSRVTDSHLFLPPGLTKKDRTTMCETYGLDHHLLTVGGSTMIGSLMVANKNGVVVADMATDLEVRVLTDLGLKVTRLKYSKLNAAGNNIVCNDKGAIVHPDMPRGAMHAVADALDVEVVPGNIAGVDTIGTAAVANNIGVLCHPLTTDGEREFLNEALHVPARIGTVNHGHGLVGAGMAANSAGVVCGGRTTGIELGRIEEALFQEQL